MRNLTDWKWIEGRLIRLTAGGGREEGGGSAEISPLLSSPHFHNFIVGTSSDLASHSQPARSAQPSVKPISGGERCHSDQQWPSSVPNSSVAGSFPARQLAIIVFLEILASCNCRLVSPSFLIIIRFLPSDNLPYPAPVSDTVNLLYFQTKCKISRSGPSSSLSVLTGRLPAIRLICFPWWYLTVS